MNEVLKAIAERYSCRAYTEEMPSDEILQAIAKAAVEAPSGMNRQAWRVIVVKDTSLIKEIDDDGMASLKAQEDQSAYERMLDRGGKLLYNAPCMMVVVNEPGSSELDVGLVTQNITLAATSLGLGSIIVGMLRLPLSGARGDEFKKRLSFPEGFEFGIGILMGYAANDGAPHEPDMSKIIVVK